MSITTATKRPINGVLILDKPLNLSSNQALQRVKRLFQAKKIGHTGSLDPLASGLLPICLGEATKFSQFLLDADKTYEVIAQLGVRTATGDAEGEIIATHTVPKLAFDAIDQALQHFRGKIKQIPSMYSALKCKGRPLYELARKGITVERPSRDITIYENTLIALENNTVHLKVHCSKGTYIRTLIDDLGELLQCGAHVIYLRRLSVAHYQAEQMLTLTKLEETLRDNGLEALDRYLLSIDSILPSWPMILLSSEAAFHLCRGQSVTVDTNVVGWVRLHGDKGFLGVGEIVGRKVIPRRLTTQSQNIS